MLEINARGWVQDVHQLPSPNQDDRPKDCLPDLVVIHAISLPPSEFGGPWIDDLFSNQLDPQSHPYFAQIAELRVSAHILIRRQGQMTQYVSFDQRAWHAGVSQYQGRERCNDFSVGIELEGDDDTPFTAEQYAVLTQLLRALADKYPSLAKPLCVVGHADISPGRKTDPGPMFDWEVLHASLQAEGFAEYRLGVSD